MIAVPVLEQSGVFEVRRRASEIAAQQGFSDEAVGRVALIATELASNLVKHTCGGEVLVGTFADDADSGLELLALDKGPGMADVQACLTDGYSSAGTSGRGLGGVLRQSKLFEVASWSGVGTGMLSRVVASGAVTNALAQGSAPSSPWGAVSVPKPGEMVCGDSWGVANTALGRTLIVADGLGHGPEAAEASVEAVRLFHRYNGHEVGTLLDYIHGGLRATRGAAVSIARYDAAAQRIVYGGIGNVAGAIGHKGALRRMVSMAGTAGHNVRKIQTFDYPFEGGLVILYSDGLATNLATEKYSNLATFHPSLIAGLLYRDHTRKRDDATVLVAKW